MKPKPTKRQLLETLEDARQRTLELIDDLDDDQLMGPKLDIINPYLWEIGHIAWFHERWILRHLDDREPLRDDADELYDSIAVNHGTRWDLGLPTLDETLQYMRGVNDALRNRLAGREPTDEEVYYYRYTTFHEDMHEEAFTYTRQTLGYSPPDIDVVDTSPDETDGDLAPNEDVAVPGGEFVLGATEDAPFAFDNEKQAHTVELDPFRISRTPVTNQQFVEFVEDGGYDDERYWSEAGWKWHREAEANKPVYWRNQGGGWQRRLFDAWVDLREDLPVVHVNYWEARAYCRWADRRLPTEAEWEAAASGLPDGEGGLRDKKLRYTWGDEPASPELAHLDGRNLVGFDPDGPRRELVPVDAVAGGDSPFGCRQMLGNVWEWTSSTFEPYPGFEPDMYEDYSQPWFGDRKVLRGGAWTTRARMVHNMWRNYFEPDRRDVYAGFRTCAK